jgi:splicing factor 45
MSLYGDLPQAKDDGAGTSKGWAAAVNKLQPRKPSGVLAPPPHVLRAAAAGGRGPGPAGRALPAPAGRGAGRGRGALGLSSSGRGSADAVGPSGAAAAGPSTPVAAPVVSSASFFSVNGEALTDEYDPSRPNDYEDILRERDRKRKEAEEEADRVKRQREAELVGFLGGVVNAAEGSSALVVD